jgi:lysyl-tRNA synthetase class 2
MTGAAWPWWDPQAHRARRPRLIARNAITTATRHWFEARAFVEVEASILQVSPGNETHLHAFATDRFDVDGTPLERLYLHTSPEFACKKLLAAGETRLFSLARVFRNRERGARHASEFTMLEWYRAGVPYTALMDDIADLLALAAEAVGATEFRHRGRCADPLAQPERLTVAEAFARHAGIDLLATLDRTGATDTDALAEAARTVGIRVALDDTWTDIFSKVLVERIEPCLGDGRATILMEYPVCEAALAQTSAHDPRVADRFEVYVAGLELANAFGELTDPVEQRRRFVADMDEKERLYGERYPLDEAFLAALAQMPPASGIALGFDRLVMLATGADHITDVIWTP